MDESLEENDEDFNFMASEEEVDHEEFRTDKGVKVSRKFLIMMKLGYNLVTCCENLFIYASKLEIEHDR